MMLKTFHAQESKETARKKAKEDAEKLREMKFNAAFKRPDDDIKKTFIYMDFPPQYRLKICTDNVIERLNREICRRTRAVGSFPDVKSAQMLVCVRTRYISVKDLGCKRYINMKHLEEIAD